VPLWVTDPQSPGGRRLNPAAFAPTAAAQQGNLGRNVLGGFGSSQFDLAIRKEFRWTDLDAGLPPEHARVVDAALARPRPTPATHVYHLFMVRTAHRDDLQEFLGARGIQTGIHYPVPIHLQEAYRDLELGPGAFPRAEALSRETLSLPMFPELTPDHLDAVVTGVREFFELR